MQWFYSNCPFHQGDSGTSFRISEQEGWNCKVCQVSGSGLYQIPLLLYHMEDEFDAIRMLREFRDEDGRYDIERFLVSIVDGGVRGGISSEVSQESYALNLEAAKRYARGDFNDDPLAYCDWHHPKTPGMVSLLRRGYLADTLEHFHVADWQRFEHYPLFFPLQFNEEVYGYQLRGIQSHLIPRFLTMDGVKKSEQVYGYAPLHKARYGIVVEGLTDVYSCWQYGWRAEDGYACFALLGDSVSLLQAAMIADHCEVVFCFTDMDRGGRLAYEALVRQLRPFQVPVFRGRLPHKDVNLCTRAQFRTAVDACARYVAEERIWQQPVIV